MAVDLAQIIPTLVSGKVDFILIGGMAGILHGSARVTYDVDLVYSRTNENIERLATALAPHTPTLRDAPADLPFAWEAKTIQNGLNFTLTTDFGDIIFSAKSPAPEATMTCWRIRLRSSVRCPLQLCRSSNPNPHQRKCRPSKRSRSNCRVARPFAGKRRR
jgi:hypothetical protein